MEQALFVPSGMMFGCVGDDSMPVMVVDGDAGLLQLMADKGMDAMTGMGASAARDSVAIGGLAVWLDFVGGLAANSGTFVWVLLGLLH